MNNDVIEVRVRSVLPLEGSFAVFLGTDEKIFVIYVDESVGTAISMFMRGVSKERPLTHDLIGHLLLAFGAKVERVVINYLDSGVFHARLILSAENQLHTRKLIEIDARPSDSIAPILVAREVWDAVEDVSHTLAKIEEQATLQASNPSLVSDSSDDNDDDEDDELDAELFPDEDADEDDLFSDDDDDDDDEDEDEDEDDFDDDDDEEDEEDDSDNPFNFGPDDDEGEGWKKQ
jgi:uncharacterized protein